MTEREVLKLALEVLQKIYIAPEHEEYIRVWWPACEQAIPAIKEALAQQPVSNTDELEQPEQEHYGYLRLSTAKFFHEVEGCNPKTDKNYLALYTIPPHRKPLTDEELREALRQCPRDTVENLRVRWLYAKDFARAIEAAHGIKENT